MHNLNTSRWQTFFAKQNTWKLLCTFFPLQSDLSSVNILSDFLFHQSCIYLPSNFLSSSSAHSLCSVWAMSSTQNLFFGFVPFRAGLSVLETRFPARIPSGKLLTTRCTLIIANTAAVAAQAYMGVHHEKKQHIHYPRNKSGFFESFSSSLSACVANQEG